MMAMLPVLSKNKNFKLNFTRYHLTPSNPEHFRKCLNSWNSSFKMHILGFKNKGMKIVKTPEFYTFSERRDHGE